jgi:hypothetical protein
MSERIDIEYDYAVCAWARHFNVSEKRVKEAVAAVGDSADKVREHLSRSGPEGRHDGRERPSGG